MTYNDEFLTPFVSEDEETIPGIEEESGEEEKIETPEIPEKEEDDELTTE